MTHIFNQAPVRFIITSIFLLFICYQNTLAQNTRTNQTNSLGQRTGRWETFYSWGGRESKGTYTYGKKTGLWTYYVNGDHDVQGPEKTVMHYASGRFEEQGPYTFDKWPSYLLVVSADSSKISGIIYQDRSKRPCIECKKQKDDIRCSRFLIDGHKVKSFKLKNTTELFLLIRGMDCVY